MNRWDERYSAQDYVFGTAPNEFLVEVTPQLPTGRILTLAEGEGRNAVYLAQQGYAVTGVDGSRVGLAKAEKLAAEREVEIETRVADLAELPIEEAAWDGVVSIFCHIPPDIRRSLHKRVVAGLKPGGVFVLEAYTPRQLAYGTGGPPDVRLLVDLATLKTELAGLRFEHALELERTVSEGRLHTGLASVVQIVAVKP